MIDGLDWNEWSFNVIIVYLLFIICFINSKMKNEIQIF